MRDPYFVCLRCSCYDSDYDGCTMSPLDKMYACSLENGDFAKEEGVMQINTERGIIYVVCEYPTEGEAREDGYTYAFTSSRIDADVYSKVLDDRGYRHEFAIVRR